MGVSSQIAPTSPYPYSNSCTWALTPASPRFPSTAAVCTGRPVLSAALPETRTAPGMERPAPATFQIPRGVCVTQTKTHTTMMNSEQDKQTESTTLLYRRFRRQDVRNGDPNTLCSGGTFAASLLSPDH